MADVTVVDIKSAWASKINWTQAIGTACSMAVLVTGGKINVPTDVQLQLVAAIQAAQAVATWVIKTWFTPTVTPASINK